MCKLSSSCKIRNVPHIHACSYRCWYSVPLHYWLVENCLVDELVIAFGLMKVACKVSNSINTDQQFTHFLENWGVGLFGVHWWMAARHLQTDWLMCSCYVLAVLWICINWNIFLPLNLNYYLHKLGKYILDFVSAYTTISENHECSINVLWIYGVGYNLGAHGVGVLAEMNVVVSNCKGIQIECMLFCSLWISVGAGYCFTLNCMLSGQ